MKKYRGSRWSKRGVLKENSNRHNNLESHHPQVRRQLEKTNQELSDMQKLTIAKLRQIPDNIRISIG